MQTIISCENIYTHLKNNTKQTTTTKQKQFLKLKLTIMYPGYLQDVTLIRNLFLKCVYLDIPII